MPQREPVDGLQWAKGPDETAPDRVQHHGHHRKPTDDIQPHLQRRRLPPGHGHQPQSGQSDDGETCPVQSARRRALTEPQQQERLDVTDVE